MFWRNGQEWTILERIYIRGREKQVYKWSWWKCLLLTGQEATKFEGNPENVGGYQPQKEDNFVSLGPKIECCCVHIDAESVLSIVPLSDMLQLFQNYWATHWCRLISKWRYLEIVWLDQQHARLFFVWSDGADPLDLEFAWLELFREYIGDPRMPPLRWISSVQAYRWMGDTGDTK